METTRQAKISRLLQKELSEIFRRETAKMGNALVTVSSAVSYTHLTLPTTSRV